MFAKILLISIAFILIVSTITIIVVINSKYHNFVKEHSVAYKSLLEINKKYRFADVKPKKYHHAYDNDKYYATISPKDYLTYQLAYHQNLILKGFKDARSNAIKYASYKVETKEKCNLGNFDTLNLLNNTAKLLRIEKRLISENLFEPCTKYYVSVDLKLTNIKGDKLRSKSMTFYEKDVDEIIHHLNLKYGDIYLEKDIWDTICRVERGKVSNKMRFSIYRRDGNKCVHCGSTRNLEIDHIIPIAKGGKTTYDNLQTLCHKCNTKKGTSLDF